MKSPPGYVIASVLVALGGVLNGYDTGSIGAVTEMKSFLDTVGDLTPQLRGFTVSLIMLTGAFPSFFAGQLADRFGHLAIIMVGALVFTLGAALQGGAYHLAMFLVGRALCGLGEGLWLSNVSVYICEIAPSARRSSLVSLPQFGAALGVCVGYFTCFGSVRMEGSMSWRLPFIIMAIISVMLAICCFFLPTSPRWLLFHGQRDKAMIELDRLNFSRVEAEKDLLNFQHEQTTKMSALEGLLMIFRRGYRARTILALFVLGMVQLCGIDAVIYYAPTLFAQAGIPSQTASFLASGVSAILMLAISVPAVYYSDRIGRRTSALLGGLCMASCMLIIGSLYASKSVHPYGSARWVVVVLIFVFALTYCSTWGIVGKVYASEIQPARTRAAANCLAQGMSFLCNWLVAFATPIFLAKSAFGGYFLFGGLTLGTVTVLALYMPETRGRSLEEIQSAFHHRSVVGSWLHHLRRWFSGAGVSPQGSVPSGSSTEMHIMSGGNVSSSGEASESAVSVGDADVARGVVSSLSTAQSVTLGR